MAFVKILSLPSGVSGEYFRMTAFRWDRNTHEAAAVFALFKDAATAASGEPLLPGVAKLKLYGSKFDQYLSPTALAGADNDVVGQLYLAAKETCQAYAAGTPPETNPLAHVVCDFGKGVFADAVEG